MQLSMLQLHLFSKSVILSLGTVKREREGEMQVNSLLWIRRKQRMNIIFFLPFFQRKRLQFGLWVASRKFHRAMQLMTENGRKKSLADMQQRRRENTSEQSFQFQKSFQYFQTYLRSHALCHFHHNEHLELIAYFSFSYYGHTVVWYN